MTQCEFAARILRDYTTGAQHVDNEGRLLDVEKWTGKVRGSNDESA